MVVVAVVDRIEARIGIMREQWAFPRCLFAFAWIALTPDARLVGLSRQLDSLVVEIVDRGQGLAD